MPSSQDCESKELGSRAALSTHAGSSMSILTLPQQNGSSISISLLDRELPESRTRPGLALSGPASLPLPLPGPGPARPRGEGHRQGGLLGEGGLGLGLPAQRAGVTHAGRLTLQHPPFPASSCLKAQWAVTQLSGRGTEIKASSLSLHGVPFCTCPDTGVNACGGGGARGSRRRAMQLSSRSAGPPVLGGTAL